MAVTVEPLTLAVGDAVIVVDPFDGGRITSWRVGGFELLGSRGDAPEEHGLFAMAPWPGRLRDNVVTADGVDHTLPATYQGWAMHGLVHRRPWNVVAATPERVALRSDFGVSWPWSGTVELVWDLGPGMLRSALTIESDGDRFPVEIGWHPWFRRRLGVGGALELSLHATAVLERGPDHLPTGRRLDPAAVPGPYDDAFCVPDRRVTLSWADAVLLHCESDGQWVVVYDELDELVCVEMQTAPPDGLRECGSPVGPDAARRAEASWSWTVLADSPAR